jgi:hypothetical protein
MTVGTGIVQLNDALKNLRAHWEQVQLYWKDPVQREFERDFLVTLEAHVAAALQGMEQVANLISNAEQDTRQ